MQQGSLIATNESPNIADIACAQQYGIGHPVYGMLSGYNQVFINYGRFQNGKDVLKVIASINKRIHDSIPLIEEDGMIDKMANDRANKLFSNHAQSYAAFCGYISGYKAASKERMYSEEDIIKAVDTGWTAQLEMKILSQVKVDFLKSIQINKLPKQVELEMNECKSYVERNCQYPDCDCKPQELKIHNKETNTINPIKLIYE